MLAARKFWYLVAAAVALTAVAQAAPAEVASMTVRVNEPTHKISPTLYGIFFEEINCGGDGGLYAELVRNRSFEDSDKPDNWVTIGSDQSGCEIAVESDNPVKPDSEFNKRYLRVSVKDTRFAPAGVVNQGYWGMSAKEGESYNLSLYARAIDFGGKLTASLRSASGKEYASAVIGTPDSRWQRYSVVLKSNGTDPKAQLAITTDKPGTFYLDVVSLFPNSTWKDRSNGLRPDLARMLDDLKPSFVRFPGGCWVEGDNMDLALRWKTTIGDIAERRTQWNRWGYMSPNGLGYHEYLQMSEDLGAEPLFVINCGMAHGGVVPMDKMQEFVQDALDAIEYANGPTSSKWGALRAANGHPKPFNLKYMEIGNENGGPAYQERYSLFYDAIRAKYPDVTVISDCPTDKRPSDVVDEHYYSDPGFFIRNANKYDTYERKGPKIYVGEYAVTGNNGQGSLRGAIGEAAFMTGMERNSDIVVMASYAPLFVNVNHRGWNPDLINFDSCRVYGTPSYWVQRMFSKNRGDVVLPVELTLPQPERPGPRQGAVGVGTWMTQAEYKDIVVEKAGKVLYKSDFAKGDEGWKFLSGRWAVKDGALQQTAGDANVRAVVGDPSWSDYTISLKARKLGGGEGFLIMFHVKGENNWTWWNIGGWGNTRHAIEWNQDGFRGEIGRTVRGGVETGRWYDVRVETSGQTVKCYLDGQLVMEGSYQTPPQKFFATASREQSTGDVIVKAVNAASEAQPFQIDLKGITTVQPKAQAIVLTSADPADENSLETPTKVAPLVHAVDNAAARFSYTFGGNSVVVLRIKTK